MRFTWRRVGAVLALLLLLTVSLVPAAAAAPNTGGPTYYWVRYGDTLYGIAARFGVSPSAIAQANGIVNWNRIYAGQRLLIPYYGYPGPCGWNPCPPPKPPPPPPPKPPYPCGWNPCQPQPPAPEPCGYNPCPPPPPPPPGPCGYNPCPPPPAPNPCGYGPCQPSHPGPMTANWHGQYYNNTTFSAPVVWTTDSPTVDYNWGGNSPGGGVNAMGWSATFTAVPNLPGGRYRVQVATDDGARVYIDGVLVIDGWKTQPVTTYTQDVQINGGNHTICIEYYQDQGYSELHFYMWQI